MTSSRLFRRFLSSRRRGALVPGLVIAAALWTAPASDAHFDDSSKYMYDNVICTQPLDPITWVSYGDTAYAGTTRDHMIKHVINFGTSNIESEKYFKDHNVCEQEHFSVADGDSASTRYHVRGHRQEERDGKNRWETVTTPHLEDVDFIGQFPPCHAVRETSGSSPGGYVLGRNRVEYFFDLSNADHTDWHYNGQTWSNQNGGDVGEFGLPQRLFNWGNTQPFRQCDGQYAYSDGAVRWRSFASWHMD